MIAWQNPVLRGNVPDPSVVRVGSDFFLATSTFEYLPGIRLFRSSNLIDWTPIGAAVTRPDQARRDGRPGEISLFAPTLRHHDGTFYLACTNVAPGQGNFLLRASAPDGDWSKALWLDEEAFDPSLFFDADGTCYYTRRTLDLSRPEAGLGPIVQAELDPGTGQLGPLRPITSGRGGFCSNDIEGPHLFARDGWYYLTAAEGGTWLGHMQTIARSRSPWGPFEPAPHNPILTHRHRVMHPIQSLGHCDFVEDAAGDWWALSLGTRHRGRHHTLGREVFLHEVEWRDGWPHLGADGTTELECSSPRPRPRRARKDAAAPFWSTLGFTARLPECGPDTVSLPAGASFESARPGESIGALFLHQDAFVQSLRVDLPAPEDGVSVGVALVADAAHHVSLRATGRGAGTAALRRRADDLVAESTVDVPGGLEAVTLVAGEDGYGLILHALDGTDQRLGPYSARLLSAETCEWFTGVKFALLAEGPGASTAVFGIAHGSA